MSSRMSRCLPGIALALSASTLAASPQPPSAPASAASAVRHTTAHSADPADPRLGSRRPSQTPIPAAPPDVAVTDPGVGDWREANRNVHEAGGWRKLMRDTAPAAPSSTHQPSPANGTPSTSRSTPASASASAASAAAAGHRHHH